MLACQSSSAFLPFRHVYKTVEKEPVGGMHEFVGMSFPSRRLLPSSFSLISAFFFAVTAAGLSTGRQGTIMPQVFMTGDKEEGARLQKEKKSPLSSATIPALFPTKALFSTHEIRQRNVRGDTVRVECISDSPR